MTTTPAPGPRTTEPWKALARRSTLWSSAAGLLLLLGSTAVVLSWRNDLPDPIASHWGTGPSGAPNGFMSLTQWVTTLLAIGAACIVVFGAIGWFWGKAAMTRRISAAATVWIGGLLAVVQMAALASQRGLSDAAQAHDTSGWWLAASYVVPLVPAVAAAVLVPGDAPQSTTARVPANAARVALADGERAVWIRRTGGGPGLRVGAAAIVLMLVLAILTRMWGLLAVPVLLAVLFASMMVFEVRVDATGLAVRSAIGWPRTFIPADEVVAASSTTVHSFKEFGGWGWRVGRDGRVGIVPRSGEALLVERTGGRSLVVTVDDSETGAAVLNTLADRIRNG